MAEWDQQVEEKNEGKKEADKIGDDEERWSDEEAPKTEKRERPSRRNY